MTATGADQAITVPVGARLLLYCETANAVIRRTVDAAAYFTVPAGVPFKSEMSAGETLYIRATAGAVVQYAFN